MKFLTITNAMIKALLVNLKPTVFHPVIRSENKIMTLLSKTKCEGQIIIHSDSNYSLILVKFG